MIPRMQSDCPLAEMKTIFTADWKRPGRKILLASQSPRRREILGQMGFAFESVPPDVSDEHSYLDANDIKRSIQRLAYAKARSVAGGNPEALVVGADTVVYCEGAILGKPHDAAEARDMLHHLRGRSHAVYSGVALVCEEDRFSQTAVEKTIVVVRAIEDREIEEYIEERDYLDKAGAYAIQESAMVFISRIEGCFYNVVGLPIEKTISLFKAYVRRKEESDG
jgi:septum formation protein